MPVIQVSTVPLETPKREGRKTQNDFLPVIASFNDGLTRLVMPGEGEVLSTILAHLRAAARTINRSVTLNWVDGNGQKVDTVKGKAIPDGAVGFKFLLRDLIVRKAKEGTESTDGAAVSPEIAAEVAEPAPKKGRGHSAVS